jgi:hypothetical protein
VAVTISPAWNRIFTISAGPRLVFSARFCGVEPRTTCRTGPVGFAGSGAGFAGAAGAGSGVGAAAGAGTSTAGSAGFSVFGLG